MNLTAFFIVVILAFVALILVYEYLFIYERKKHDADRKYYLALIEAQQARFAEERKDLYNRIMSKNVAEYKQANEPPKPPVKKSNNFMKTAIDQANRINSN
jgi:hypothetical protein